MFRHLDLVWARRRTPGRRCSVWWPAILEQEEKTKKEGEGSPSSSPSSPSHLVKFLGATNRKRVPAEDVVHFDALPGSPGPGKGSVRFEDPELDSVVKEALAMRRKRMGGNSATVKVEVKEGDENTSIKEEEDVNKILGGRQAVIKLDPNEALVNNAPNVKTEEENEDEDADVPLQEGWKDDFLASLDDDEDEDKENDASVDKENRKSSFSASAIRIKPLFEEPSSSVVDRPPLQELQKKKKVFKPTPVKKERPPPEPKEELSEYEKIRLRNIAEQRAMFAALMEAKMMVVGPQQQKLNKPKRNYNRRRQSAIPYSSRTDPVRTRRRSRLNSEGSSYVTSEENTPRKRFHEEYSDEEEDSDGGSSGSDGCYKRRKVVRRENWCIDPNTNILAPEDVTEEMLDNVADRVSEKIYDQARGTTCHQCRQKTKDTKTVCRSGHCAGGRGMFCGVCLLNRYGEVARECLKDPNWMCPPCLDICNCSICRNRLGKGATGPITYLAQSKGFKSVKDFLASLKKGRRGEEIIYDDDCE